MLELCQNIRLIFGVFCLLSFGQNVGKKPDLVDYGSVRLCLELLTERLVQRNRMDTPRKTVALNCVMMGPIGMTAIFSDQEALDGLFTQSSNDVANRSQCRHGDERSQLKTTDKRNTTQSCK